MGNVHKMCGKACNDNIISMDDTIVYGEIQPEEIHQRSPTDCFAFEDF